MGLAQKRKWKQFEDLFGDVSEDILPVELSHYCDLTALLSILTNGNLWASNIRFLNDKEEMEFGFAVAKELLEIVTAENDFIEDLHVPNFQPDDFDPSVIPDVYAVSFCENPDLLSMWRGYGAGSQSVSIQFNRTILEDIIDGPSFRLSKVIYGRDEALTELRENIDKNRQLMTAIFAGFSEMPYWADKTTVYQASPKFKNEHFKEEQEWRLISNLTTFTVNYRPRGNVLLPYIVVKDIAEAISSITVGPGKDSELTKRSIEHCIRGVPEFKNVRILLSEIPYRT